MSGRLATRPWTFMESDLPSPAVDALRTQMKIIIFVHQTDENIFE